MAGSLRDIFSPKSLFTLSLITIIAIILTLQAAFPTLINYILFVVGVGIVRKFIGFLIFIPSKIMRKAPEAEGKEEIITGPSADDIFLDELAIPLLSVPPVDGGKIKKYVGLVGGEAVAEEKKSEGRLSKLTKIIEPTLLDDFYLGEARKLAISRMLEEAKSIGANNVIDVIIDYVSMGGLQGTALIVTATGTAVIVEDGTSNLEENGYGKGPLSEMDEKNNFSEVIKKISDDDKRISGIDKKINVSGVNEKVSGNVIRRKVTGQIIEKRKKNLIFLFEF